MGNNSAFGLAALASVEVDSAGFCDNISFACDDKDAPLVGAFCPMTCGCDNPLSGLQYSSMESGCPRTACLHNDRYRQILDDIPCDHDPSRSHLMQMKGWSSYWSWMWPKMV